MSAPIRAEDIPLDIPDPDALRDRLAVVLTEAGLLRAQLRVSLRLQRERERLRRQRGAAGTKAGEGDKQK
jgi:hypothetical protein